MKLWWIVFLLPCLGCSPHSLGDFQKEGEARCQHFIDFLCQIENHEQLAAAEPILKKKFESLVDLMIQAREFQFKHPEDLLEKRSSVVSDQLKEELKRMYGLEGGRDVIERAQQEALVKLDAFERILAKRRSNLSFGLIL